MPDNHGQITEILASWRNGDPDAAEQLFPIVYNDLRDRARKFLARERADHTLQPTALVHEAYLRLVREDSLNLENKAHFFGIAARVMRQILVDHARQHNSAKRGGSIKRFSVEEIDLLPEHKADRMLHLDEALESLEKIDGRKCRVVEMRFFGGMSEAETALALGVSEKTVRRDWKFAKLWLLRELSDQTL